MTYEKGENSHEVLLECRDITKTFGSSGDALSGLGKSSVFKALNNVSLHVNEGECVGLVGPSGSGKTTLARVLASLEEADTGQVRFCNVVADQGKRVSGKQRAHQRATWLNMQMIFQNPEASFLPNMTLEKAVAEGMAYQNRREYSNHHDGASMQEASRDGLNRRNKQTRRSKLETRHAVLAAFEAVGLPVSFTKRHAFELSGGQCQRAAIARAIVSLPRLIICDEPTSSLDVVSQASIMDLLVRLHNDYGMAFVFISHNTALVQEFCTRFYRLEHGEIVGEFVRAK